MNPRRTRSFAPSTREALRAVPSPASAAVVVKPRRVSLLMICPPGRTLLQVVEGLAGLFGLQQREVWIEVQRLLQIVARPVLLAEPGVNHAGMIQQGGVLRPRLERLGHRLGRLLVALVLAQGPRQRVVGVHV